MAEGLQIGELPQKENLTGNELIPFQQGSSNGSMSTATLKKYIGTGGGTGGSTDYMNYITEYNVSVQHPTSGIGGSNKYSLEGAIAQVPQELRNIGLKVSFINSDGKVETWEFQGGTFTDVDGWKQIPNQAMVERIDNDIKNVNQQIEEQSQIISGIQDSIGGKEINVDIHSFKMQFQSLENTYPGNSILDVDYVKTKAAWTEVYFSKSSDNSTDGVQIYRSNKVESGSKQIVAPSPSDYPYIIYKGYDLDATVSISYTLPTIDEKIEEANKEIKLLNKLDTHIPTLQETASVSIMLDSIDAFFSWCDVANPMGIPVTCCLNAFIYKNRSIQDKEKFKSLIQAGNGFIAHGWNPHKGSNNFSDAEFEDTIKSAKEYFISQGLKTEGWCPPENYMDAHSAVILSKYYNYSIGTTSQRYFNGEARFITASTNRWYIPRHGMDNTELLDYSLTLLDEAVKHKKHLALYTHNTATTGDRDRILNAIKDYVDKGLLVVVDANTQYTSLLKTWRNNISMIKPVFPFVGSAYFGEGVKVCTDYGTREKIKISFTGSPTNGVITLKEYTTTLFRSENIDNEVEGISYTNKPWSVATTDDMSVQDICTALASIHLACHTMINMGDHLIVESDVPRKWVNTISVAENTSGLEVSIEVLDNGVDPTFQ